MAIHYGVEVNKGKQGDNYLKWMGGYFETFWSVNPFWTAKLDTIPEHETTRGVKPFAINDEWYYHMRFVPDMKGVTPVLSAVISTVVRRRSHISFQVSLYPLAASSAAFRSWGGASFGDRDVRS